MLILLVFLRLQSETRRAGMRVEKVVEQIKTPNAYCTAYGPPQGSPQGEGTKGTEKAHSLGETCQAPILAWGTDVYRIHVQRDV